MKDRRWGGNRKGSRKKRVVGRNEGEAITQQEDRCGMPEKRKWKAQRNGERKGESLKPANSEGNSEIC